MMTRRDFLAGGCGALLGVAEGASAGTVDVRTRARTACAAFVAAYWVEEKAYFRRHKGKAKPLDFWFSAHAWDMLLDADRLFRTAQTKTLVRRFYASFCARHPDWRTNVYNDDILWWTIACTNAYVHTKERAYLTQGKALFDHLAAREIDETLGGGMWWRSDERKSKNACCNFPAVITAANLFGLTKEKSYLETAKRLFAWSRKTFFDEATGAVYDNVNRAGHLTRWDFTYNVGTFIGSALRLARYTGEKAFLADAEKAGRHFMGALSRDGIVKPCGKGDGGAFHGVGFRYFAELARRSKDPAFRRYLLANAAAAWAHRRPGDDLVGPDWRHIPEDAFDIEGQVANSALTLLLLTALPR